MSDLVGNPEDQFSQKEALFKHDFGSDCTGSQALYIFFIFFLKRIYFLPNVKLDFFLLGMFSSKTERFHLKQSIWAVNHRWHSFMKTYCQRTSTDSFLLRIFTKTKAQISCAEDPRFFFFFAT